jgi:phosphoglycerol transferase
VLLIFVYRLWRADLTVPFSYDGDAVSLGAGLKGLAESPWYVFHPALAVNPALGAPYGQAVQDYPVPDILHLLAIKLLTFFAPNYAFTLNLYFCISFPLTALVALAVLRRYQVSFFVSLVFSLLFAFLPYHMYRGVDHELLACYYTVPLIFVIALEVMAGNSLLLRQHRATARSNGLRLWQTVVITIVTGTAGLYYAFFGAICIFVAGLRGAATRRSWRPFAEATLVCVALLAILVCACAPTLVYTVRHGSNPAVAQRIPAEAETFGLRITQLILPIADHYVPFLKSIRAKFDAQAISTPPTESRVSSLGFIGTVGFMILLGCLLIEPAGCLVLERLRCLSALNITAVLLATIGGFGSLFAFTITPGIRAYNRISIFVGFMSLFALALLIDALVCRYKHKALVYPVLGCLLLVGIFDQRPFPLLPPYAAMKARFLKDQAFIRRIEASLPAGSMILQLPYLRWPEHGPLHLMPDYEPFRGYIHSKTLRWSYGAMVGRYPAVWIQNVSEQPVPEQLATLAFAGFSGIYIDTRGYPDKATNLISTLSAVLRETPISNGANIVFFDIRAFARQLRSQYSAADWEAARWEILNPLAVSGGGSCSALEGGPEVTRWRWCDSSKGELIIENRSARTRPLVITMNVNAATPGNSILDISGGGSNQRIELASGVSDLVRAPISAMPGRNVIRLASNAIPIHPIGDPRSLAFRITNLRISDPDEEPEPVSTAWNGCSAEEVRPATGSRLCSDSADLTVTNRSNKPADLLLTMSVQTTAVPHAVVRFTAPGSTWDVPAGTEPAIVVKRLLVPPGPARIHIDSDAGDVVHPGASKRAALRINDFRADAIALPHVIQ